MVQNAAIAVMEAIDRGQVDVDQNFHSYLRQRCRWRMMTVLQRGGRQEFDLDGGNVPFSRMIAALPGQAEVETRLFLHQLQHLPLDTVRRRCRFRGRAYQACLYIAEQLLAAEKVDLDRLRALGLAKPQFYRDYVRVILRAFLADFYQRIPDVILLFRHRRCQRVADRWLRRGRISDRPRHSIYTPSGFQVHQILNHRRTMRQEPHTAQPRAKNH